MCGWGHIIVQRAFFIVRLDGPYQKGATWKHNVKTLET